MAALPNNYSPLQQHPLPSPRQPTCPPTPPTQTLILSHPSARLSSSPASSPRVESPPARTRSIRPEISHLMDHGTSPGPDFFEDSSGDDSSEWEDDNGTRNLTEHGGIVNREDGHGEEDVEELARGRRRGDTVHNHVDHDSQSKTKGIDRASQMSLRRLGNVRIVHNRGSGSAGYGTPRASLLSDENPLHPPTPGPGLGLSPFPELRGRDSGIGSHPNMKFPVGGSRRHRSNTSESIRADSILNAHAMTMKALESLPSTATLSAGPRDTTSKTYSQHSSLDITGKPKKSASFSENRRVVLSPPRARSHEEDVNRPAHLPAHFIKTPYPFSAKKEFPIRSATRLRAAAMSPRLDKGGWEPENGFDNKKGKHVLGIAASDGEYDLRSRLERNEDAQGVIRIRNEQGKARGRWKMDKSEGAGKEATLWLTLRKNHLCRKRDDDVIDKIESISVPNNLTTSPIHAGEKKRKRSKASSTKEAREEGEEEANIDFDDQLLAHRLRSGYNSLTLPHILRIFSARQLYTIRLGRISPWSGTSPLSTDHSHPGEAGTDHLLTSYSGFALSSEDATPFTEHALMHLYRNPSLGKARYTWIHWARRVSAWNNSADREKCADGIVTIQFEQSWSTWRILFAMGMAMALSVLSVLLWVLLGVSPWALPERRGRAERVEGGVMLGVFVMLMQSVVLAVWIALSWMSG